MYRKNSWMLVSSLTFRGRVLAVLAELDYSIMVLVFMNLFAHRSIE